MMQAFISPKYHLSLLDSLCLRALWTRFCNEINPIPFGQRTTNNLALMDKNIFAPVSRGDETKTFCGIKPFHCSLHDALLDFANHFVPANLRKRIRRRRWFRYLLSCLLCLTVDIHASSTQHKQFTPTCSGQAALARPAASRGRHDFPAVRSPRRSDKRECEPGFQVCNSARKSS